MPRSVYRNCHLCEACCGLEFHVEGDKILSVRPDAEDARSQGYACPKGIAIAGVHDDPDRLRRPMRRTPSGDFEPVSWDVALKEACARLGEIRDRHGRDALAVYVGNPVVHDFGVALVRLGLLKALGTRNCYSAGSQDTSPRFASSWHLYGTSFALPIPDLDQTDYLLCIGANPLVSNGSILTAPNMRGRLRELRARGGRLVVVDPRRTETAREADEHVAILPGGDTALLLGMLRVLLDEDAWTATPWRAWHGASTPSKPACARWSRPPWRPLAASPSTPWHGSPASSPTRARAPSTRASASATAASELWAPGPRTC